MGSLSYRKSLQVAVIDICFLNSVLTHKTHCLYSEKKKQKLEAEKY